MQNDREVDCPRTNATAKGVPRATGMPMLIKTGPKRRLREPGGAMPSAKWSGKELNACPPTTKINDEVRVLLKPNENVESRSVVPSSVPFAWARTASVGPSVST
jgi:hypothetical protein